MFEIANRVMGKEYPIAGMIGTIIDMEDDGDILVEFDDSFPLGHSGSGLGKSGHCYWVHNSQICHYEPTVASTNCTSKPLDLTQFTWKRR
jgi:hypothetical protein